MKNTGWLGKEGIEKGILFLVYVGNVVVFMYLFNTRYSIVFAFLGLGFLLVKVLFDGHLSARNRLRMTLLVIEFGLFYGLILVQRFFEFWTI
jgi:hypothetical protein